MRIQGEEEMDLIDEQSKKFQKQFSPKEGLQDVKYFVDSEGYV